MGFLATYYAVTQKKSLKITHRGTTIRAVEGRCSVSHLTEQVTDEGRPTQSRPPKEMRRMPDQAWILAQTARLFALNAEVAGMQAENDQRKHLGESMAYVDMHFQQKADEMRALSDFVIHSR